MVSLFVVLISFVGLLLLLVIMVQEGKGGGLSSSAFGGNQMVGGVKETGDFLTKSTWTLAIVFAGLILISNVFLVSSKKEISNTEFIESTK